MFTHTLHPIHSGPSYLAQVDPRARIAAAVILALVVAMAKRTRIHSVEFSELVSEGKADALVSLGNTGGIFAAGTFKVGRIPGVE